MKLFNYFVVSAVVAMGSLLVTPTSSSAATVCASQKFTYKNARLNARAAEKNLNRAERNLNRDTRYYDRQIEKANNRLARVNYRLEYLRSQQIGGFVGTLLGGGWGLNNNISLNSKIDALKKQRDYYGSVVISYTTAKETTLARDNTALATATAATDVAYAAYQVSADALSACLNATPA